MTRPDFRRIAREAVPVNAGCFDCGKAWPGAAARAEAHAHREAEKHAIWVECKPAEAVA